MRIDEPIAYRWPYEWNGNNMATQKPVVNRLLKALIEEDYIQIKNLYEQEGASLQNSDQGTLSRIIYEKLSNYEFIEFLLRNELISSFIGMPGAVWLNSCTGPDGYSWGLLARAGVSHDYDVMELLALYRFENTSYCIGGEGFELEDDIFRYNDVEAFKVLHENGATKCQFNVNHEYLPWLNLRRRFPNSKVTAYLNSHKIPKRYSLGLDSDAFYHISPPTLEREGLFGKKNASIRNEMRMKDYEDRVRAQKSYLQWLQSKNKLQRWVEIASKQGFDAETWSMLKEIYNPN